METFFNIRYEFDRVQIHTEILSQLSKHGGDYICVADGVILDHVNRDEKYNKIVNNGMFAICDSSYVPLYLKWIYGIHRQQYSGSQIFEDIISQRKYRMIFMGASNEILGALQKKLLKINPDVATMKFVELPFKKVNEFDYPSIAKMIEDDGADIIWIALGAPKQEYFMANLKPHLSHGVMIAVGAAFKFFSGIDAKRAPEWMVKNHMEFIHRIFSEPKKQIRRCWGIVKSLPKLLIQESNRKRKSLKYT
ncbi:WecB/TagA/CpsF family glycosyltransferase [uncultured Duncaniella sp.]|uniref:WecB/TagA/CpsF family glycosyltransferase n=1 Tax=uncultured Duncaniella sp. TaxID=2768039 RepID=UPI00262FC174|nr:WecB/TagA/CpsF family glycosyltransferase [uncultured Duncaniella sp.]